jgi:prepilin-type N-terminal cleavage/methylation domain-containing protein
MRWHCVNKQSGFTLIEMLIVMSVFIIVLMITADAFNLVLSKSKSVTMSEESTSEGIVGLEMFRHDIMQAGFGLFNDVDLYDTVPGYSEANKDTYAKGYNEVSGALPRPVIGVDNIPTTNTGHVLGNSDYLVIKATTVGSSEASQKWTYVAGAGASKTWKQGTSDLKDGVDRVVVVKQSYRNGEMKRRLIYNATSFSTTYKSDGTYASPFRPTTPSEHYYYYGVDTVDPRAPFNRVDYMVKRIADEVPHRCSQSSGILYKEVLNQSDGSMTSIPLLDCVADMQVVFGWNTDSAEATVVDTYSNSDGSSASGKMTTMPALDAGYIGKHLKLIKVYILAQDGGFDPAYTNTNTAMVVGDASLGEGTLTHTVDLTGPDFLHYRWKLHRIVIRPKNLL